MILLRLPFLSVLALFFAQGIVLWLVSLPDTKPHELELAWFGVLGSVMGWWAIWLALTAERGWQRWLEWLALMGATFWLPLSVDQWVRPHETGFISFSTILYLILALAVPSSALLALAHLLIARLGFGWRLEAPAVAPPFGLRGMFLMTLLVAGHLMAFLPLLREIQRLPGINDLMAMGFGALVLLLASTIVLGGSGLVLARAPIVSIALAGGGIFLMLGMVLLNQGDALESAWTIGALLATSVLQGFGLRMLGYRITTRRDRQQVESLGTLASSAPPACVPASDNPTSAS